MKRVITFTLIVTLLPGVCGVAAYAAAGQTGAAKFKDIPQGVWYYPYVDRLTKDVAITGVTSPKE